MRSRATAEPVNLIYPSCFPLGALGSRASVLGATRRWSLYNPRTSAVLVLVLGRDAPFRAGWGPLTYGTMTSLPCARAAVTLPASCATFVMRLFATIASLLISPAHLILPRTSQAILAQAAVGQAEGADLPQ